MYYRLESTWYHWERYFHRAQMYTRQRKIDEVHNHELHFDVPTGHQICGLWLFTDPADAIAFWHSDPGGDQDEKSRAAAGAVQSSGDGGGRFVIRAHP